MGLLSRLFMPRGGEGMFKKILVYSEGAVFEDKNILRLAAKIVESSGGEILALHVIAQPPEDRFYPTVRPWDESVPAKATEAAQEKARIYRRACYRKNALKKSNAGFLW
jgi:hypothetical protein